MFAGIMNSPLSRRVLELLNQNVFPTLVSTRQNGRAGLFSLMITGSLHDTNPIRLVLIVFTLRELLPKSLKIDRKILIVTQESDS